MSRRVNKTYTVDLVVGPLVASSSPGRGFVHGCDAAPTGEESPPPKEDAVSPALGPPDPARVTSVSEDNGCLQSTLPFAGLFIVSLLVFVCVCLESPGLTFTTQSNERSHPLCVFTHLYHY